MNKLQGKNLYCSLFTYKAKADRSPLEEFLSGALADILSRMETATLTTFLELFDYGPDRPNWSRVLNNRSFCWDSEHSVWSANAEWGRADIIALEGSDPFIIVENKVGAPIGQGQLELYESALLESPSTGGALLFLTHSTECPDGFRNVREKKLPFGVAKWSHVFHFLLACSQDDACGADLRILTKEFASFLEAKDLHMEMMTATDVASLRLYMDAQDRIEATLRVAFESVRSQLSRFRQGTRGDKQTWSDGGTYIEASFQADGRDLWGQFGAGIVFPDKSQWFAARGKASPQLTVWLYREERLPNYDLPDWTLAEDQTECAATTGLFELLIDEQASEARVQQWASERGGEIARAVMALT